MLQKWYRPQSRYGYIALQGPGALCGLFLQWVLKALAAPMGFIILQQLEEEEFIWSLLGRNLQAQKVHRAQPNACVGQGLMKVSHSSPCFSEAAATLPHEVLRCCRWAVKPRVKKDQQMMSTCGDCILPDVSLPSLPSFFPTPLFCFFTSQLLLNKTHINDFHIWSCL